MTVLNTMYSKLVFLSYKFMKAQFSRLAQILNYRLFQAS